MTKHPLQYLILIRELNKEENGKTRKRENGSNLFSLNRVFMFSRFLIFVLLVLIPSQFLSGQSRNDLERQKKEQEKEISHLKKILSETNQKQRQTLAYLTQLNHLIAVRER